MKVQLSRGGYALVDPEDYHEVSQYRWYSAEVSPGMIYAMATVEGKSVYMHRLIMQPPKGMIVDHINGDRMDNRRSNLRICTWTQNNANTKRPRKNKSGYVGVRRTPSNKWEAAVQVDKKTKHLGTFDTAEDAARARDKAALEAYGKYCYLNFPE